MNENTIFEYYNNEEIRRYYIKKKFKLNSGLNDNSKQQISQNRFISKSFSEI